MRTDLETRHWMARADGAIRCQVCPQQCRIPEGGHGLCFVRRNEGGRLCLWSARRYSGMAVDPVEKKPLYHFLPGTRTLSLGGIGCNLRCSFCQNAAISRPDADVALGPVVAPEALAEAARAASCPSVSFTYNEPVIALESVVEAARACRAAGLRTIAVTNGYIEADARAEFFEAMDAANVDLKAFTDDFYRRWCGARLAPVLETLQYLRRRPATWLEITTLLIPGANDSAAELNDLTRWVANELGRDVPLHFSAFHPAYRRTDLPPTPAGTLFGARDIALRNGLAYVYVGNLPGASGQTTACAGCGRPLIARSGLGLRRMRLGPGGVCPDCRTVCPGVFGPAGAA